MQSGGVVRCGAMAVLAAIALAPACPAAAQSADEAEAGAPNSSKDALSAVEVFDLADQARDRGDFQLAESAYRALTQDDSLEVRTEARFRLAKMLAGQMDRPRDAAVLLRRILDDKPDVVAVRLELARVQAMMGNYAAAERELRAVQAGELPPQVQQLVRFYAGALASGKPVGGTIELAFAPSTNINRATTRTTLDTIIGEFTLDEDAQARSGVGLSVRGQAFRRFPLGEKARMVVRVSGDADLYRDREFSDVLAAFQAGPEFALGRDRLSLSAAVSHRWFGFEPYLLNYGLTGSWRHPLSRGKQIKLDASATRDENRVNPLQTGTRLALSGALDAALSQREGIGASLFASRFSARDPGYSNISGGVGIYAYRELGRVTAVVDTSYSWLQSDKRLFLYPERRRDHRLSGSISATFRNLQVLTFAPLIRARWERNFSTVGIFDFQRIAGEVGITSAF